MYRHPAGWLPPSPLQAIGCSKPNLTARLNVPEFCYASHNMAEKNAE
jgi:hypothetical protein